MENSYETVYIISPDASAEVLKSVIDTSSKTITDAKGEVIKVDEWGRKKLAYPIQKKNEGYYVIHTYKCVAEASHEVERLLRYNENVMRFQTVRLEEKAKGEEK